MCVGPLAPSKPPAPPPPPPVIAPTRAPDINAQGAYDAQRRAAAAAGGRSDSIKTGADLETTDANKASRQLLG